MTAIDLVSTLVSDELLLGKISSSDRLDIDSTRR